SQIGAERLCSQPQPQPQVSSYHRCNTYAKIERTGGDEPEGGGGGGWRGRGCGIGSGGIFLGGRQRRRRLYRERTFKEFRKGNHSEERVWIGFWARRILTIFWTSAQLSTFWAWA
uniref:Uncharacterized protein n=1 Tax=Oryza glumipatula TaxID=40148 RepID=A0A0E0A4G4_9ORYZ